ncbi:hypothetical protein N658DRAFT_155466 [Parathielavia hyrcaniae]|uniref:Uncharacterized protein n=1 Tax=Parathielavia hyrcaniae TaxID=113614 RepID=A0AAN6Q2K3_9PEZI|nr:hypothetical protein N658DRAFT_155466 [Parathielavia hyrcaniae]
MGQATFSARRPHRARFLSGTLGEDVQYPYISHNTCAVLTCLPWLSDPTALSCTYFRKRSPTWRLAYTAPVGRSRPDGRRARGREQARRESPLLTLSAVPVHHQGRSSSSPPRLRRRLAAWHPRPQAQYPTEAGDGSAIPCNMPNGWRLAARGTTVVDDESVGGGPGADIVGVTILGSSFEEKLRIDVENPRYRSTVYEIKHTRGHDGSLFSSIPLVIINLAVKKKSTEPGALPV